MDKPKIVIVEDDLQKRTTYAEKFRTEGFEVFEAQNGKTGLDIIISQKPNLIFTGIQMPEMDGFTMIGEIRRHSELVHIPIMMSSHLNRKSDQEKAKALGIEDFFYYGFVTLNEVARRARKLVSKNDFFGI